MGGGVLRFERDVADGLLDSIRRAGRSAAQIRRTSHAASQNDVNIGAVRRKISPSLSALKATLDPPVIAVQNSDGDKLQIFRSVVDDPVARAAPAPADIIDRPSSIVAPN
jgi:hypothetical protein